MTVVRIDAWKTANFSVITSSYTALGTPVQNNWRAFRITNNTDGDMAFSLDGTTDNLFVPAFSFVLYDVCANSAPDKDALVFQLFTQFYIRYVTAPTKGDVYLEGIYARGNV